jgi:carbon-monoxide dehydrogenase small subunit
MTQRYPVNVTVNGVAYQRDVEARLLLSDFLRHEIGLTGTHVGCEHGVCGACTILLDGESACSCLMFAVQADASDITTVKGLQKIRIIYIPCNKHSGKRMDCNGYCTQGFYDSHSILKQNPDQPRTRYAMPFPGSVSLRLSTYCGCGEVGGREDAVIEDKSANAYR